MSWSPEESWVSSKQSCKDREGEQWAVELARLGSSGPGGSGEHSRGVEDHLQAVSNWNGLDGRELCPHSIYRGSLMLWPQAYLVPPFMVYWGLQCHVLQQEGLPHASFPPLPSLPGQHLAEAGGRGLLLAKSWPQTRRHLILLL